MLYSLAVAVVDSADRPATVVVVVVMVMVVAVVVVMEATRMTAVGMVIGTVGVEEEEEEEEEAAAVLTQDAEEAKVSKRPSCSVDTRVQCAMCVEKANFLSAVVGIQISL